MTPFRGRGDPIPVIRENRQVRVYSKEIFPLIGHKSKRSGTIDFEKMCVVLPGGTCADSVGRDCSSII